MTIKTQSGMKLINSNHVIAINIEYLQPKNVISCLTDDNRSHILGRYTSKVAADKRWEALENALKNNENYSFEARL